jgi:very-short-patch-repair endonuclease
MDRTRRLARELRNHTTDAEQRIWRHLRGRQLEGFRFRRQVPIAGYVADFVCPQAKLIVELDGGQHQAQAQYDAVRTAALERLGYRVLRYWNDDALLRTESVLDDIHRELTKSFTPPRPSPSLREREGVEATAEATAGATAEATAGATAEATAEALVAPGLSPSLSPKAKGRAGEGCS